MKVNSNKLQRGTIFVLLLVGVLLIAGWIANQVFSDDVPRDNPRSGTITNETLVTFPELRGITLSTKETVVPNDLTGNPRLIVVAYDSEQQPDVDGWLPALEALNQDVPELAGYYVPLLPKSAADSALFIVGGMYLAAKNDRDRERTIVVFTDVEEFNRLVDVPSQDDIRLFLINGDGEITWQGAGAFNEATLDSLKTALEISP